MLVCLTGPPVGGRGAGTLGPSLEKRQMVLQTLIALYSFFPGGTGGDRSIDPASSVPRTIHSTITLASGTIAQVLAPNGALFARYPGTVIIATEKTRERALLLGNRMSEIGVTVIMYVQDRNSTDRLKVFEAEVAIDSMRKRRDVRREEVGVIAFDDATGVVPNLVRDSTLHFAIAASSKESVRDLSTRYTKARAATLLVQGVDHLVYGGIPLTNSVTYGASVPPMYIMPPTRDRKKAPSSESVKKAPPQLQIAPNVTVWPVPQEQLAAIGDTRSALGNRVMGWLREQIHAQSASATPEYSLWGP